VTTVAIPGTEVAVRLNEAFAGVVIEATQHSVTVPAERAAEVALWLRDDEEYDCKFLNCITGIDWMEHFDVVYVVSSLAKNHMLVFEARASHDDAVVPTVNNVWMGANLQEREIYDLMGIVFSGHPNMKRIFLWDGFPGHPLRKDFLALPQGHKPGLQRFPYEFPAGQRSYESLAAPGGPEAPAVPRLRAPLPGQAAVEDLSGGQLSTRGGGSNETRYGRFEQLPPAPPPATPIEGEIVVENVDSDSDDEEEKP
jgi:NADH-quinone oxidoreductase subunit C